MPLIVKTSFASLLLAVLCIQQSSASVFVRNHTYDSLPALFGHFMLDGKTYQARLQYFHENPYLCELTDQTESNFVSPQRIPIGANNFTVPELPVAILASRGNCPFQQKAAVAETIDASVKFLVVYNYNVEHDPAEEDVIVPMYSQFGSTRLVALSISHATGKALKQFLSLESGATASMGGPIVKFDSEPPWDYLTEQDLQSMMLSAMGLFFMLISFTGCLVILFGAYNQVVTLGGGNPIAAATGRRLLTEREVHQLRAATTALRAATTTARRPSADDIEASPQSMLQENDEEHQCAVCIDDFDADSDITSLPCNHDFHTDCILPWLTERQSKCPLCKFDVLAHLRDQPPQLDDDDDDTNQGNPARSSIPSWHQLLRWRWDSVGTQDVYDDGEEENVNMTTTNDLPGVEMTPQQPLTTAVLT